MVNLDGISVALVTPWQQGTIDAPALQRLVEHVCGAGVVNVCPAGTTGEGPRLSRRQRVDLVRQCAQLVAGRAGIVGGIASASVEETLAEIKEQAEAGAGAVLVTPPTRLPLGGDGCRHFFTSLAHRSPIPIILYHIPSLTGIQLPPETVLELAGHERIIGLKDSSADIQYHMRLADGLAARPPQNFSLLCGTDAMMVASLQAGGAGGIIASANIVPGLSVALHGAFRTGDIKQALELERKLRPIIIACRRGHGPAGWKAAVEIAGLAPATPVPPGEGLDNAQYEALRADLQRLEVVE